MSETAYTVGAKKKYEDNIPSYKNPGGAVWKNERDARSASNTVEVDGRPVPGGVYEVELPNSWDEDVKETQSGRGKLQTRAKINP